MENKFNEVNIKDLNIQSNYKEIINKINEKNDQNKNNIDILNEDGEKNSKIFEQIERNFKKIDTELSKIENIEKNEAENYSRIIDINKKIIKLENMLNRNGVPTNEFNNKIGGEDDKMNEVRNINMEYLENKLNEFKEEQENINMRNNQIIEKLRKKINDENNDVVNMPKEDEINNSNNEKGSNELNDIELKFKKMEEDINDLKETTKKMDELHDINKQEAEEAFNAINNWINNFRENVNNRIVKLKEYIDKKITNIYQSIGSYKEDHNDDSI